MTRGRLQVFSPMAKIQLFYQFFKTDVDKGGMLVPEQPCRIRQEPTPARTRGRWKTGSESSDVSSRKEPTSTKSLRKRYEGWRGRSTIVQLENSTIKHLTKCYKRNLHLLLELTGQDSISRGLVLRRLFQSPKKPKRLQWHKVQGMDAGNGWEDSIFLCRQSEAIQQR
jgi:hypothetical protein